MTWWRRILGYPRSDDVNAVARMTARQWAGIARRTVTYAEGYQDRPGSEDRAQRRARWIAAHPIFRRAGSVLELGCGMGRNLAELGRAYPALRLTGLDVCLEAVDATRRIARVGNAEVHDLYDPTPLPPADVVLTCGVLVHLHPGRLDGVLRRILAAARVGVLLIEDEGHDEVVKGPRAWQPELVTGEYVLWRPSLKTRLWRAASVPGWSLCTALLLPLPADLVAPGARTELSIERRPSFFVDNPQTPVVG